MDKLQGSWIWYELLSPDPEGSRAFYEHVVGWTMTTSHEGDASYGFIARADGGMTGGMLRMSQEMQDHGARPCWLGYVGVDDCDAAIAAIEAAGGKYLARGGTHKVYEGDWEPRRIVLFEFPSVAAFESFYNGPVYQGLKPIRDACSSARLVSVEGLA